MPPTKNKSRGWTFTFFGKDKAAPVKKDIRKIMDMDCNWMIFQLVWIRLLDRLTRRQELSTTTGRKHLQGAIHFKTPRTLAGTKKRFPGGGVHLEAMRGTCKQSREYCMKLDTRVGPPDGVSFEKGMVR